MSSEVKITPFFSVKKPTAKEWMATALEFRKKYKEYEELYTKNQPRLYHLWENSAPEKSFNEWIKQIDEAMKND